MPDNTVTLVGNITREPELRFTPSGQALATFGLAVNRRWQNKQTQEWEEQVSFFDVTCWGTLGQNVADTMPKGSRAIVTGRLEQQSWETDKGEKRSKVQITADEVGPSLRWATAEITRNERSDSAHGGGGAGGQQQQAKSNTGTQRSTSGATGAYDPAEEPF